MLAQQQAVKRVLARLPLVFDWSDLLSLNIERVLEGSVGLWPARRRGTANRSRTSSCDYDGEDDAPADDSQDSDGLVGLNDGLLLVSSHHLFV